MNFNNFINNNQQESYIIIDNYKLVKIKNNSIIYNSHIRNNLDKIFIDSISVERVNHTKDYVFYGHNYLNKHHNRNILFKDYKDILEYVKNNIYLENLRYLLDSKKNILTPIYKNTKYINIPTFYIDNSDYVHSFAHTICYFYPQIYYFIFLQKYIPNLLLTITAENQYTKFLLNLLDIKNYKIFEYKNRLINENVTYFMGFLNINFSSNIINNYFYDIIVNKTILLKNKINISNFPKKLLFLRNSTNAKDKNLILKNRKEIVKIAKKFNYVDIDQTTYDMESIIKIVNNATHIILESGSSLFHLLWNKNIKGIMLNCRMNKHYLLTIKHLNNVDELLKLVSDNSMADIVKIKNITTIYNDENYIRTGKNLKKLKHLLVFTQTEKLIKAIKDNE